jgi:4-amino-4-deoxy-L-arabinose transferase-like glycosyltransferase
MPPEASPRESHEWPVRSIAPGSARASQAIAERLSWRDLLLLWGFAFTVAILFCGSRPLADPDEGRYAAAAREMLERGNYFVPMLDHVPHLTKSPATYWSAVAGFALLGMNEWGARLGSAAAFAIWIVLAARLAMVWGASRWGAFVVVSSLASSALPFVGGSLLTADPFLATATAAAALAAAIALRRPERREQAIACFWLALGLAFFIKGPPSLLVLAGLRYAWPLRTEPRATDRSAPLFPVLAALLIGLWWYLLMILTQEGADTLFLRDELYRRVFTAELRRSGAAWMPACLLVLGTAPWSLALIARLALLKSALQRDPIARLLFGWLIAGVVVFTLSQSRQPMYVLPLATALSVPAGLRVARWAEARRARQLGVAAVALALACFWLAARYQYVGFDYRHSRDLAQHVSARLVAAPGGVALLQTRLLPGLSFYLPQQPLQVAWKRVDRARRHDLDRPGLLARIERTGAVVVVGRPEVLDTFPKSIELADRTHDSASDMDVAIARGRRTHANPLPP